MGDFSRDSRDDRGPRRDSRGPRRDSRGPRRDSRGPRRDSRGPRRQFNRGPREMHKAICSDCGNECEVPFKPTEGREVFCQDCFKKKRDSF